MIVAALIVVGGAASFVMGSNDVANATGSLVATRTFSPLVAGVVGGGGLALGPDRFDDPERRSTRDPPRRLSAPRHLPARARSAEDGGDPMPRPHSSRRRRQHVALQRSAVCGVHLGAETAAVGLTGAVVRPACSDTSP